MHKPGWRSRRRSRLSLVERAVPKLGHIPELDEGPKPTLSSPALKPPLKQALKATAKSDRSLPDSRAADDTFDPSSDSPVESKSDPSVSPQSPSTSISGVASEGGATEDLEPLDQRPADLPNVETETTIAAPAEAPELVASRSRDLSKTASPVSDPTEPLAPTDDHGALAIPAEFDPAVIEASLASLGAKSVSLDGVAADGAHDDDDEPPLGMPGPVDNGPLELDWGALIDSGFTDPRDRGRPLPSHMDPIIRTLLRQALSDQASWRDRVILVTSPTERISKTTAAINFAFGLSTIGNHKAVLVDVDITGSGGVGRLGGADRLGITEALADDELAVDKLTIETGLDHLTLVACGRPDREIIDRFGSQRMLQILRFLTEDPATILVIDAPPILVSQEAAVLNVVAGQVVMAVEAGRTTADQIEHALQRLGDRHNVSLVLNASSGV
ncbi:MAG: hypothetical protein AAGA73_09125, partial [Pseudomonadota bacterium]